ncbi:MAG: recombination protein RecR [Patescibacteria group bacterium]|nr:MAG: recombination protein RecR [Patescibacteria group bacterium]
MRLPKTLEKISEFFRRLPGIGKKTADRLSLYLLQMPQEDLENFSQNLKQLKTTTKKCRNCLNLTEEDICPICQDEKRDQSIIMVVETPLDLLAFENGQIYEGVYHVLYGKIDPLNNIGPDDIYLKELFERIKNNIDQLKEIIIATDPDMEGEATAMYIRDKIKEIDTEEKLKITRIASGVPIGANIEFADYMTLKKSIQGREVFK